MLRQKLFTVCAIGPIRLLALASYRSLTNQILIFGILDLNFSLNFISMQAAVMPPLSYSVVKCACKRVTMDLVGEPASDWLRDRTKHNSQSDSCSPTVFIQYVDAVYSPDFCIGSFVGP